MDINEKKLFIYKNINDITNHNDIINYIKNTNDDQLFLDKRDEIIKSQPTITNNVVKNMQTQLF